MAFPVIPVVAGVAVVAALVYVVYQKNRGGPRKMVDKAQYAVGDAADAAIDTAESVADKATEVVKDIKKSVT